ncbi:MAG TPA: ComEC/Rec2 family competence protein [Actinomycetota bacterium]
MGGAVLSFAAAAFAAGILLAIFVERSLNDLSALGLTMAGALVLGFITGWRSRMGSILRVCSSILAFVLLGMGWGGLHELRVARSPLAHFDGRGVRIWGSLTSEPAAEDLGWKAAVSGRAFVLLTAPDGPRIPLHDSVWVEGDNPAPVIRPGASVVVEGTIRRPGGAFGDYLIRRGYSAVLDVDFVEARGPPANRLQAAAWSLRSALAGSFRRVFPPKDAGLLMGLSLGDTSRLDPQVEEGFRATGLSHLTAVSGENLVMFLAPILGFGVLLRLGPKATLGLGAAATGFFVLLTGGEPSVLRAAAMAWLAMTGIYLGRPRSPPAIMGGAVLILLALNPTLVHSIGFQLSVAATAGMAMLAAPLAERMQFIPRWVALPAATTMAAQAGVTPLLLYHFGVVPTVTVIANVLAFPSVGPAMILGLTAACLGLVSRSLGWMVAALAKVPLHYLQGLAHWLARSPLPIATSSGSHVWVLVVGIAAVLGSAWWLRSGGRIPRAAIPLGVAFVVVFTWSGALRAGPPHFLTVTFFDVGQGDAALVRSPEGASILIDGGPDEQEVARKLAALGIRRIDLLVATHPHADHVAGLPSVLARFAVTLAVDPGCFGDSPFYQHFLRAIRAAGVPFRHPAPGSVLAVGNMRLEFLGPDRCFKGTDSDPNNDSLVFRLTYGPASILFPGDAEQPAQETIVQRRPSALTADVLKVAHHGGDTSLDDFVAAVHARLAVVSVGPNRYGHPVPSVLAELRALGMRVFRTDLSGDVTVAFRGEELLIESGHG